MCEYTSPNKKQTMTTDICYIDKTIDKLLMNGQTKIALEYIDEIMEINNNSYSINTQLLEKLSFTKERINKLNYNTKEKTKCQLPYNVYDINSIIEYINDNENKLTDKNKKNIVESILTHNELLMYELVKHIEVYEIIEYIPSKYITKDFIIAYLEEYYGDLFKINIPSTLSDDDYVEIMCTIFHIYSRCYDAMECDNILLHHYMEKLYDFTNKNIIAKFFDEIEIDCVEHEYRIKFWFFDFESVFDSDNDMDNDDMDDDDMDNDNDNSSYDWLTNDIILRAVKLGQNIKYLPKSHITKNILLASLSFDINNISRIKDEWLIDGDFVEDVLRYTREIINKLKLTDEQINKLIVSYNNTIKYLPNINYDMCYRAYKKHGDTCVKYMPKNLRKLFN